MGNVVPLFHEPRGLKNTSEAFDEAWKAFPEQGRIRSSRREAYKEWKSLLKEVSEADLLRAVRRYAAEDKEHKRECGPPGFHRWLKWGRWEHWIGEPQLTVVGGCRFPDERIRSAVVAATSEGFVISYLDPCEVAGSVLIVRTSIAIDKLKEKGPLLKSLGFTGMRKKD